MKPFYALSIDNEFYLNKKLNHLVDDTGVAPSHKTTCAQLSAKIAAEVASRMLRYSLYVQGEEYVLTELELYYGGIGDCSHRCHVPN